MTCWIVCKVGAGKEGQSEGLATIMTQDSGLVIYYNCSDGRLRCKWPIIPRWVALGGRRDESARSSQPNRRSPGGRYLPDGFAGGLGVTPTGAAPLTG